MKLPSLLQFRVLKLAVTSLFSRPFTTKYPAVPYEPQPSFRGRPRYHESDCIGCGACAEVCPADCIDVEDDVNAPVPVRKLIQHLDSCICCGQCERYCPTQEGIRLSNEFDFAGFAPEDFEERVDKELLLCESCGVVIAPKDQLKWLARRLGPLAYTNSTLMLVGMKDLSVVDPSVRTEENPASRGQHLTIQCPRCRRTSSLAI